MTAYTQQYANFNNIKILIIFNNINPTCPTTFNICSYIYRAHQNEAKLFLDLFVLFLIIFFFKVFLTQHLKHGIDGKNALFLSCSPWPKQTPAFYFWEPLLKIFFVTLIVVVIIIFIDHGVYYVNMFCSFSPEIACVVWAWCSRTRNGSSADAETHLHKTAEKLDLKSSQ